MMIEVRGVNFINKGAELMLHAIAQKLRHDMDDVDFVMVPSSGNGAPYKKRVELDFYQKLWIHYCGVQWGGLGKLIPKRLRDAYGMVLDSEIDAVLDASGFAYSDQWGVEISVSAAKAIKRWKRQGTKVIFLPQALGPFTMPAIRAAFRECADSAELIFARDQVSYEHLVNLVGNRENIKMAPDFTNLVEGVLPDKHDALRGRFCVIPNSRMLDKTREGESSNYVPFLAKCIRILIEYGESPYIMVHEGEIDVHLSKVILAQVGQEIPIVREHNPIYIKGILGSSSGVVSSRYHGLVSALSQGVPSLGTGWSHKYKSLFDDYDFSEGLLNVFLRDDEIESKIMLVLEKGSRERVKNRITSASQIQRERTLAMWKHVITLLKN